MDKRILQIYFLLFSFSGFTQVLNTDAIRAEIVIHPIPFSEEIKGEVSYYFDAKTARDSIELNAVNMKIYDVKLNQKSTKFKYDNRLLKLKLQKGKGQSQLKISYSAMPAQSLYFIGWDKPVSGTEQIWTQGQGKYSSHWVPSFDDMTKKVAFDISIVSSPDYSVIANGKLEKVTRLDSLSQWNYHMEKPMSSYLLAFVIGKFDSIIQYAKSGVPLILYYPKGQETSAQQAYHKNVEIFNFLESEIGVPFPWENYKQVPIRDFMYAGMENTGLTTFDDAYLADSIGVQDRNYAPINAHELAHQWFGNLVTETDGGQHWLHEGFASFYGALAEEHILGKDHLTWKLYQTANQLLALDKEKRGTSLLNPKAGSLIFYEKGAWALFALREILGSENFKKGIRAYLTTYAYRNATVDDFLKVMENYAGISFEDFRATWLESDTFPWMAARDMLKRRSDALKHLIEFKENSITKLGLLSDQKIHEIWKLHDSPEYKAALIQDFLDYFPREVILEALESNASVIQREILSGLKTIDSWAVSPMEHYLEANSYEVRYQALLRLWISVPQKRTVYIQRIHDNGSLANLKIRQLWWTLTLLTDGYLSPNQSENHLTSLIKTTHASYHWETRMHAFQLISQIGAFEKKSIKNLIQGSEHHAWQFKLFCRRLLDEQIAENLDIEYWQTFIKEFPKDSFPYFYTKISEL